MFCDIPLIVDRIQGIVISLRNVLLVLASIAAILIVLAPFVNENGAFINLNGTVGIIDHLDLWSSKDPFTFVTYFLGDFFCPQQAERSFYLNGSQLAFCIRDVSILAGFIIGCFLTFVKKIGNIPMKKALLILVGAGILMAIDWTIQHFCDLNVPLTRVITGILLGISVAVLVSSYDNIISSG